MLTNYAVVLSHRGQPEQGLDLSRRVLAQHPRSAQAWTAAGTALRILGDLAEAATALRQAYELAPLQFETRHNLAKVLVRQWRVTEADELTQTLVADEPASADAWILLSTVCELGGRRAEAIEALRRAYELQPHADLRTAMLFQLQYAEDVNSEMLLGAHCQWNTDYGQSVRAFPAARPGRRGGQPLRIGFISPDFALHPIGFFALPVLESLDKTNCSVICYFDRVEEDLFTPRFRGAADVWRPVAGLTNRQVAEQIASDEIDVLVDLSGHASNRLLVFAQKPAPVQISWLGYVGTTGLSAMDYLLADRFHVPPGEEKCYTETVLRMPHGYACYGAPPYAPDAAPLRARNCGAITFGAIRTKSVG